MKVTNLTSKDLLIQMYGHEHVHSYDLIKRASMRLGHELAAYLTHAVGGTVGSPKDPYDAITAYGHWEFALQHNTKNKSGNEADLQRTPGHCVQILGNPRDGWISAEEFLSIHGLPDTVLLDAIQEVQRKYTLEGQLRLKV